jgi:hypothetical protein
MNEETELQCEWPEPMVGRKLLVEFVQFKLSLNLPVSSISSSISSTSVSCEQSASGKLARSAAYSNRSANDPYVNVR